MKTYMVISREGPGHEWSPYTSYFQTLPEAQALISKASYGQKEQFDIYHCESVLKRCWEEPKCEEPTVVRGRKTEEKV